MPFDQVRAAGEQLSADRFLELPLAARVQHILGGNLQFSLDGAPVDKTIALKALRTLRTPEGANH